MPPAGALVVLLQVELAIVTSIYGGAEKGWFFTTGPGTGTGCQGDFLARKGVVKISGRGWTGGRGGGGGGWRGVISVTTLGSFSSSRRWGWLPLQSAETDCRKRARRVKTEIM